MKDTNVTICNSGTLAIKELRQSYTTYTPNDGFDDVNKRTETFFHWKITTLASKISATDLNDDNKKEQEVYYISLESSSYELGHQGFKTRENAILNALEFAKRNGIVLDGYSTR